HVVGDLHALRRDRIEVVGETALHVRRLRGRAHEVDIFAEVLPALAASDAMAAPARRVDGNAVANLQAGCGSRDLYDFAGDLMAEYQRRLHHEIAGPGMAEIVHVRAADAAGAEADAHHACGQLVERMLDHAQI